MKKNHMYGHHGFISILDPFVKAGKCNINYSSMRIDFFHDNGKTAQIYLCHLNNVAMDLPKYQGSEMHVLLIDESASFPKEAYIGLRNRLRLGTFKIDYEEVRKNLPFVKDNSFPRIICASNPVGIGMDFFKKRFVDPSPPNKIFVDEKDPETKRLFIPAFMWDNVKGMEEDPGYMNRVASSGSAAQQALIYGQWDVNETAVLGDLWDAKTHVIDPIKIPPRSVIIRSMDWGTFHPSVILYFLIANGEEYETVNGGKFQPAPGSVIVINEIYNCDPEDDNAGNRRSAVDVGRQIAEFESSVHWMDDIRIGVADNQIFRKGAISETIHDLIVIGYNQYMNQKTAEDPNFRWSYDVQYLFDKADQSSGSRVSGLNLTRNYLQGALKGDDRGLYLVSHCRKTITELPMIPRSETNPEDADQSQSIRDHGFDAIKMTLLSRQQDFQPLNVIGV